MSIAATVKSDLSALDMAVGARIRNTLGLWSGNGSQLDPKSLLKHQVQPLYE